MDENTKSFALRCAVILVTVIPALQMVLDFVAKVLLKEPTYHGDDKIIFACVGAVLTIIYTFFKKR